MRFDNLEQRQAIREMIIGSFSLDDLETMAFDLGISDEVTGTNLASKAREIMGYMERHNKVEVLIDYCAKMRPNVSWQEVWKRWESEPISKPEPELVIDQSRPIFSKPTFGTLIDTFISPNLSKAQLKQHTSLVAKLEIGLFGFCAIASTTLIVIAVTESSNTAFLLLGTLISLPILLLDTMLGIVGGIRLHSHKTNGWTLSISAIVIGTLVISQGVLPALSGIPFARPILNILMALFILTLILLVRVREARRFETPLIR